MSGCPGPARGMRALSAPAANSTKTAKIDHDLWSILRVLVEFGRRGQAGDGNDGTSWSGPDPALASAPTQRDQPHQPNEATSTRPPPPVQPDDDDLVAHKFTDNGSSPPPASRSRCRPLTAKPGQVHQGSMRSIPVLAKSPLFRVGAHGNMESASRGDLGTGNADRTPYPLASDEGVRVVDCGGQLIAIEPVRIRERVQRHYFGHRTPLDLRRDSHSEVFRASPIVSSDGVHSRICISRNNGTRA